ncbi:hypothetical protein DFH27DRAFT_570638 [Peziza echinospora]|nr:hypothetical protein DFH27DRAFT_570638 [Peziza echinospora]
MVGVGIWGGCRYHFFLYYFYFSLFFLSNLYFSFCYLFFLFFISSSDLNVFEIGFLPLIFFFKEMRKLLIIMSPPDRDLNECLIFLCM